MSIDVGAVASFAEGQVSIVTAGRIEIGVARWCDEIYAIGTICSHQGGPLCRGVLAARLAAPRPGDMVADDAAPVIACPWHGWEFDLRSGEAICDPAVRIRTFPVRIADGRVLVDTGAARGH